MIIPDDADQDSILAIPGAAGYPHRMTVWMVWALGCPRSAPEVPAPEAPPPAPVVEGWHCTAFVSRAATTEPFTVEAVGATPAEADANAWARACEKLPPTDPPGGCKIEAPPDGWSWNREVTGDGNTHGVLLTLTPDPVPYRGEGDATTSQDDACGAAYVEACRAAGAEPGCQVAEGFTDGGVSAVEQGG